MRGKKKPSPHAMWDFLGAVALAFLSAFLTATLPRELQLLCLGGFLGASGAVVLQKAVSGNWGKTFIPGMFFLLEWMILSGRAHGVRMEITLVGETTLFFRIGLAAAVIGAGTVFWLLFCHVTKESMGSSLFLAAFAGFCCFQLGYELSYDINALADRGVIRETTAVVAEVRTTTYAAGRYGSGRACVVELEENELMAAGGRVKAPPALARMLRAGERVKVYLRPGALGAEWLECVPLHE